MNSSANRDPTSVKLTLSAPLSGLLVPIGRVPDPVFAQKMVGDGISIDPFDQCLRAPCDGEIAQLHPAGHAITLTTPQGIEILMHIGLDTVGLRGAGFAPLVKLGDLVRIGDTLIEFDADFIATRAKSLLTQIIITNSDRVAAFTMHSGTVTAVQDVIMELTLAGTGGAQSIEVLVEATKTATHAAVPVPNPTSFRTRPAAMPANIAKKLKTDIRLRKDDRRANAESVVAIVGLETGFGDKVILDASSDDTEAAVNTLTPLLWE